MDDFSFVIEGDILYRNEITNTDQPNKFEVVKVPVINKECFIACFNAWMKGENNGTDAAAK